MCMIENEKDRCDEYLMVVKMRLVFFQMHFCSEMFSLLYFLIVHVFDFICFKCFHLYFLQLFHRIEFKLSQS